MAFFIVLVYIAVLSCYGNKASTVTVTAYNVASSYTVQDQHAIGVCRMSNGISTHHHPMTCYATSKKVSSGSNGFGSTSNKPKNELQGMLRSVSSKGRVGAGSKQLRSAANTFDRIRKQYGKEYSNDIYIRSPNNSLTTYWFVGKVAYEPIIRNTILSNTKSLSSAMNDDEVNTNTVDDVKASTADDYSAGTIACLIQKRLIMEYSIHHLRPQNLGGTYSSTLEIWIAPPDSEMDVAQNKVTLQKVIGSAQTIVQLFDNDNNNSFKAIDCVGYNPEIYIGDEITQGGLRVQRNEYGQPTKPVFEVNEAA